MTSSRSSFKERSPGDQLTDNDHPPGTGVTTMPILLDCELVFKCRNTAGEEVFQTVYLETPICPKCRKEMTHVKERCCRIDKRMGGITAWLIIERRTCDNADCEYKSARILPDTTAPRKHYGTVVIGDHVREGITGEAGDSVNEEIPEGGDEGLPSERTQRRWLHWMMANLKTVEAVIMEQRRLFPHAEGGRFAEGTLEGFIRHAGAAGGPDNWLGILLAHVYGSGGRMETA